MLIKQFFNFLESFELGYIDWGNNRQCASKLCKNLSDDLRDKLMTRSDNYALMREHVITLGDAGRLMSSVTLTGRMVVSILAELYDPC